MLSTKWLGGLRRRSVQQGEAPAHGVEAITTGNSFALWHVCRSRTRRPSPRMRREQFRPMTRVRTIRCLRACLMVLFVVAQVAGVVPLICDHTLNVYETAPVAAPRAPFCQTDRRESRC